MSCHAIRLKTSEARLVYHTLQVPGSGKVYQILDYRYVDDMLEKRQPYREQHLASVKSLVGSQFAEAALCIFGTVATPY